MKDLNIEITVLGDPKAQKRHRHARMGNFVKVYDPSSADKGDFLSIIQSKAPEKPLDCALLVEAEFYFSRPKSHYKTGKNSHILRDNNPVWHTSRNDVDNLLKFCLDAMNKIYWKDDAIIAQCTIKKQYSDNPRTEIRITKL